MRSKRKIKLGKVISDKMDKTVVVEVMTTSHHPIYKKTMIKVKKYKVHDENDECKVGDLVSIMETKPISKTKRWRVFKVVEQSK